MGGSMRAFVAIDLPESAVEAVARLQAALPVGQPVKAENFHLTLAFLGEQPEALIEEAHHGLQRISAPDFDLKLAGLDTFGGEGPKILFVGAAKNEPLGHLRKLVRSAMHGAGIQLNRERFRPHVTLARFRRGMTLYDVERLRRFLADYADFALEPFGVRSFTLYRSTLRPEGAVHEELARYDMS